MNTVFLVIILLLIIGIVFLFLHISSLKDKIQEYSNTNQKINNLNVLQDFLNAIGEENSVDEKIKKINNILIDRYNIKYSTIVIYNGAEYVIKASNVEEKHWNTLSNLQDEEVFRESIISASPKYITIENEGEILPYLKMEFARAKSAIFYPIYFDNVYAGYWIIEGSKPHEFDNIDTTILEVIKNNIVSVIKTIESQSTLENIVREDPNSKLKSAEFLYTDAKKIINKYQISTVCLYKIINLQEINEKAGRKTGDAIIAKISEIVNDNLADEYFFVRYIGPKFAIVFSGAEEDGVIDFMQNIKNRIESIKINTPKGQVLNPKINVVLTAYYKGTSLDGVTKKLEEYLDNISQEENNISCL